MSRMGTPRNPVIHEHNCASPLPCSHIHAGPTHLPTPACLQASAAAASEAAAQAALRQQVSEAPRCAGGGVPPRMLTLPSGKLNSLLRE